MKIDQEKILALVKSKMDTQKLVSLMADKVRENIRSRNLIDSGFLERSVYTMVKDFGDSYDEIMPDGKYRGEKSGNMGYHEAAKRGDLGDAEAGVFVAATYAIFNELEEPFLTPMTSEAGDFLVECVDKL